MKLIFKNFVNLTRIEHENILKIRNIDYVRSNMKSKDIIAIEDHIHWVDKLKHNNSNIYYAVYYDDVVVGAIYITEIDYEQKKCTWGLYFKQNINPFISSVSTYCIIDKIFNELNLSILNLEVNKNNIPAYKFDLSFGFKVYDDKFEKEEEYYLMKMTKDFWNNNRQKGILKFIHSKIQNTDIKFEE
ncbi:UDP-4-amino-4,6-dideoxy-N-acetyl-beta-L-altrosamine N-acetyltransferase [Aliarcobacter cryaerophilus]|uniref:UDP-4-amino-4, 6-dideoxy-N-acetyl-beta-L-altrosamine N-acetyltransferase n=1 Tax=Aliarcobacter cryaerophilus TaxID=28198 RepID=UPI0021B57B63|nr:UDP-4-amino-4,6-dideoxy-N-acetyl-beta-L-altrosamine N-acetyltransferase [Aliarcobacter cryaerophilus]MCT7541261.1 UDP-4-amino-4,6-dideoxy-N-acetyl-beta-L-altrosamine N-acetyltransferase [Aliarcobacter cryaerophilus]